MSQSAVDTADAATGNPQPKRGNWNVASQLAAHFIYLVKATAITWWRHAPWLLGFMLFAMTARYASMLVTSQVAIKYPFFVMFGMAFGLVVNLVMIILAIRAMIDILGVENQPTIRHLLETSVVPFMLIYLAFGYMSQYMSTLLFVIQARSQFAALSEMLAALNPTQSVRALVSTIVIFVASFLLGYLVTWLQARTSAPWLSLISAFLSAVRWVLGFYSVFRIWEVVRLWLYGRQFSLWWEHFGDWLSSWMHINVPAVLSNAWAFFAGNIWPGLWGLLVYPLVWFALIIVVMGGELLNVNAVYERVMRPQGKSVIRRIVLDNLLGRVNLRILPIFNAFRDMLKATVPFLGAYVILFTLLTWIGDGLERLVWIGTGMRPDAVIVALVPVVDIISSVLVMSLKIALLVTTYQRAITLAKSPHPKPATAVAHGLFVVLIAIVLAIAQTSVSTATSVTVHSASQQGVTDFKDSQVTVSNIRVGTELAGAWSSETTDQRFLAVSLSVYSDTVARGFQVAIIASGHTYKPYDNALWITTIPGFRVSTDYVFEISTADLQGTVFAEIRPNSGITVQPEVSRFRLDASIISAPSQGNSIDVDESLRKDLP